VQRRLEGHSFGTLPTSDVQCSRSATGDVCGVNLCDQHRRMVTAWSDGCERLSGRAEHLFAECRVAPSAPFVGEHELYPLEG